MSSLCCLRAVHSVSRVREQTLVFDLRKALVPDDIYTLRSPVTLCSSMTLHCSHDVYIASLEVMSQTARQNQTLVVRAARLLVTRQTSRSASELVVQSQRH